MNEQTRHTLRALLLCCLLVAASWAQYVEDSIDVGGAWVGSLAYNSSEDVVYGASEVGVLFAISCDSNKVVKSFPLHDAFMVAYDSIDNRAYCTFYNTQTDDSLLIVDGATHTRIKSMPMDGATLPVWDAVSNRVYVSCQTTRSVAVVDCASDSLLMYIPVGDCPLKLCINTLRRKLYVLNYDEGSVSVVDMTTNQVIRTIEVGDVTNAGYYCRSVDRFYCGGDDEIVVLDGYADSVVARIRVIQGSSINAVSGDDKRGIVIASVFGEDHGLYAINAATNTADTFIETTGNTYAIYLSRTSDRFYCTISAFTDEVVVLSGDGRQQLAALPVADWPYVIAQSPVQGRLYVGHLGSSKVYVIRDATIPWPEGQPSKPDTVSGFRVGPSPFHGRLSVVCGTTVAAGTVNVYSEDGRLVRSLNATKSSGHVLRLTWDGRDNRGRLLPPGVYVLAATGGVRAKAIKLR